MKYRYNESLTERQNKLIEFLLSKEDYKKGLDVILESDIYYYEDEEYIINNYYNTAQHRALKADVRAIKACESNRYIILGDTYKGYKIATKKEEIAKLERDKISILKRIKLYNQRLKRLGLEGQVDLFTNEVIELVGNKNG